jgi:hypothetical protein
LLEKLLGDLSFDRDLRKAAERQAMKEVLDGKRGIFILSEVGMSNSTRISVKIHCNTFLNTFSPNSLEIEFKVGAL